MTTTRDQAVKDAALAALLYQAFGGDVATGKYTISDSLVEGNAAFEVVVTRNDTYNTVELSLRQKEAKK